LHPLYAEQTFIGQTPSGGPLAAASKMVPVPETLMSPDVCPAAVAQRVTVTALSSQLHKTKGTKNKGGLALYLFVYRLDQNYNVFNEMFFRQQIEFATRA